MPEKAREKLAICFVAPLSYPLFNHSYIGPFGGWEVRVSSLAKELATSNDLEVFLIVADHGQPHSERIDDVTLISWQSRWLWGAKPLKTVSWGVTLINWLRFVYRYRILRLLSLIFSVRERKLSRIFYPVLRVLLCRRDTEKSETQTARILSNVRSQIRQVIPLSETDIIELPGNYVVLKNFLEVFSEVNADVYVVPGNTQFSAEVAYYCSKSGRKFVFLSGSDHDYYAEYKDAPEGIDIYGVPHALKVYSIQQADLHITQNQVQSSLLQKNYNRNSIQMRNPINLHRQFERESGSKEQILWIGKSDPRVKRPQMFIDLAKRMPEYSFYMVLNVAKKKEYGKIMRSASKVKNLKVVEHVPYQYVEKLFANSILHVNTSIFEGFPNTFLQSAKYGVPVISMVVDPGEMLSTHNCGAISGDDIDDLERAVRLVLTKNELYSLFSKNSFDYVRKYHDIAAIAKTFKEILSSLRSDGA